jgi:hypothetical protein
MFLTRLRHSVSCQTGTPGGNGGYVAASLVLATGQQLDVCVGAGGAGGSYSGSSGQRGSDGYARITLVS